jgi:hypothetical protein
VFTCLFFTILAESNERVIISALALAIYYCYRQLANLLSALAECAVRKLAVQEEG